ncbi:MAG: hypothetical protein ACYTEZ_15635 [Planctomycetota bacterium]|jgi:hypothetical protein
MRAAKPMMVYVTSDDPTDKVTRKLEQIVFKNEKLGVGAKFFDTIKVSAGDALQDRILKEHGRFTPRLLFLGRDYTVHAVLRKSQLTPGRILRAMKSVVRKEYVNSFDQMVKGYIKLLNELDRLEGRKTQLADMRARLQGKPNRAKAKKLERKEQEYLEDRDAWTAKEREILAFRTKDEAEAEA